MVPSGTEKSTAHSMRVPSGISPVIVTPMAPTLAKPFHRPGWVYEEKYDGWRMIAYKDGPRVRLISRNNVRGLA